MPTEEQTIRRQIEALVKPGPAMGAAREGRDHADDAFSLLIESHGDVRDRDFKIRAAQVNATLSLRDAVLEATQTLREIATQLIPKEGEGA